MEREANLPPQPRSASDGSNLSTSSSSPQFLRHVQAAFKRHRTIGAMASNVPRARRILNSGREPARRVSAESSLDGDTQESQNVIANLEAKMPEDSSSITPPSITETVTSIRNENFGHFDLLVDDKKPDISVRNVESQAMSTGPAYLVYPSKRADEQMATDTVTSQLSSHLGSLALTESDFSLINQVALSSINNQDLKQRDFPMLNISDDGTGSGGACLQEKRSAPVHEHRHVMAFLGKDAVHSMSQSVVTGSSCATTMSVHSTSAPMPNSTTYNPHSHRESSPQMEIETMGEVNKNSQPINRGEKDVVHSMTRSLVSGSSCITTMSVHSTSAPVPNSTTYNPHLRQDSSPHMDFETFGDVNPNPEPINQGDLVLSSGPKFQSTNAATARPTTMPTHMTSVYVDTSLGVHDKSLPKGEGSIGKESDQVAVDERPAKKESVGDISGLQSQAPATKSSTSDVYLDPSQSRKAEKAISGKGAAASRKKTYDPNVFFKVNGKLYQKLGKIGSGGSSEVHKVIASDCTIYALKKIKLKGRDYSTAYGFCQEIEYLNKLKGKNNIIELIDYEVTDKVLLDEVMKGSMTMKDRRIQDDGYIYMVLEYGEIDLAHMLLQKWKEMNSSSCNIDENWLRFYWQQILQAVNTIHEERIVHSDLKPANFLLVKGSLKLIDFGIAKAILNDTTNIQRDAQVGTLNYMSPEAFMWNDHDANGNMIKCGRPSDIWSLGCILYQMVYGRTPFAEYKTFWAKFKVITDCHHEITYDPVSNPWLLDLMKKCLAWERTERWRIPELLQHPFLVPPVSHQFPSNFQDYCQMLLQMTKTYANFPQVSRLCSQLMQILANLQTE